MKRKFKISLKVLIAGIILSPILYFLIIFFIAFYGEYKAQEKGARNVEWQRIRQQIEARIYKETQLLDKAEEYEKTGQYELAAEEYKKVIELGEDWMGHAPLARLYEKIGQYDLAIKELDWLISQKPRQEVIDEYAAKKKKLEALLKENKPEDSKKSLSGIP